MRARFQESGVKFELSDAGKPLKVAGDEYLLKEVLRNLVDNAVKFNPSPEKAVVVSCTAKEGSAVVSVGDNGPGIPPEIIENIFDPGFTTKKVGEGTGLGLWIANREIERLGGRITVESEVGKFTCFTVMIPRHYDEEHE